MAKTLIIKARRDGHRRCGVAHSRNAVEWPASQFSAEQLKTLKADPDLLVQEVDNADAGSGKKSAK